jgi:RimJ/RimL family protein N-acetyltransferase
MVPIVTERLVARNFRSDDWEALHELIVQYEASEYAAHDQQWPTSVDEIRGITEWFASGDSYLAVCLKNTGQLIGFVARNLEEGKDGRVFSIGYVFDSSHHGQGYATEACRAILNQAFSELQASSVMAGTAAVNRDSCRLLERLGFRKTGERTCSFKTAEDGRPIEFLGYTFAISKAEWESRAQVL